MLEVNGVARISQCGGLVREPPRVWEQTYGNEMKESLGKNME